MFESRITAALTPLSFSSVGSAPDEAFEMWRDRFGDLNEIIPAQGVPFAARVEFWRIGRFIVSSNASSPVRLVRTRSHARRDGLDHWVMRVSRRGVVRSRSGDVSYVSRPGDLLVERLSQCYDDDWSADEWIALIFPPGAFPDIDRTLETLSMQPMRTARSRLLADYLLALERRLPGMMRTDIDSVARATRAMVATLSGEERDVSRRPTVAARLRAEQVIRANLASARLDAQRIAALAGVSRSTLYRLFEDEGGVAAHLRHLRLDKVHAAMMDPDNDSVPINVIAASAGFHCVASLTGRSRRGSACPPARSGPGAPRAWTRLPLTVAAQAAISSMGSSGGRTDR